MWGQGAIKSVGQTCSAAVSAASSRTVSLRGRCGWRDATRTRRRGRLRYDRQIYSIVAIIRTIIHAPALSILGRNHFSEIYEIQFPVGFLTLTPTRTRNLRACFRNRWSGRLARSGRRPADRNCGEPAGEIAVPIGCNRCFHSVRRVAGRHRRVACATRKRRVSFHSAL